MEALATKYRPRTFKDVVCQDNIKKVLTNQLETGEISITIASKEHNKELANNIIREVQKLYDKQKYITVKFQANS